MSPVGIKGGPAEPERGTRLLRVEMWLRRRGWRRASALLAWWDERGLR